MRITEIAGVVLSFDPKPIQGDWNGAAAHTNYSTKSMRSDGGIDVIKAAIEKLGLQHNEHISAYGEGNERRLTSRRETADISKFSSEQLHMLVIEQINVDEGEQMTCDEILLHVLGEKSG